MSALTTIKISPAQLPGHLDLPDTDGKPVDNTYQPLQWALFLNSIGPHLRQIHSDGRFLAAADHGIYFEYTDPPLNGCRAPDFMIVEGVPPTLPDYIYRRSYVLWKELIAPTLLIELVSGDGSDERDRTPATGKFWIYEQVIRAGYYCIYDPDRGAVELNKLEGPRYRLVPPNARGHYPIPELNLELGTVRNDFMGGDVPWLRFFDADGKLLLTGEERAELEHERADQAQQRADQAQQRADQAQQRADRMAEKLRQLGIEPNGA